MTIWCKQVHRLELQQFFIFCVAHLPVRRDIETKFPISYSDMHVRNKKFQSQNKITDFFYDFSLIVSL